MGRSFAPGGPSRGSRPFWGVDFSPRGSRGGIWGVWAVLGASFRSLAKSRSPKAAMCSFKVFIQRLGCFFLAKIPRAFSVPGSRTTTVRLRPAVNKYTRDLWESSSARMALPDHCLRACLLLRREFGEKIEPGCRIDRGERDEIAFRLGRGL